MKKKKGQKPTSGKVVAPSKAVTQSSITRQGKKAKRGKRKRGKREKEAPALIDGAYATAFSGSNFPDIAENSSGREPPLGTIPNLDYLLNHYGIKVWYDIIGKKVVINIPGQSGCPDNADSTAWATILSLVKLNKMATIHVDAYLFAIADRHQYNPVSEWIQSKVWDGKDRLQRLCNTLTACPDFPAVLLDVLVRRWLISAVAAAMKPSGFVSRGVLVLQGPQSIGKTRWVMSLVPDRTLQEQLIKIDHHLDASDKDSKLTALRHWIVEIGELDSSFKKDVARLKGFITGTKDKIRVPYGKVDSEFSRRTVFCATVNKDDFLVDDTGNTRWWTIPVTHIDYEHDIDMQQLFAQVYELFNGGEQWWLTTEEEAQLESCNEDHQATTAVRDLIEACVDFTEKGSWKKEPVRNATEILNILGIQNPTNAQTRECGVVLKGHLGQAVKSNGKRGWRLQFPSEPDITKINLKV